MHDLFFFQITESVKLGQELETRLKAADGHRIPYAALEGIVTEMGKTFTTKNSSQNGVVLHASLKEHKSKRAQGFW